MPKRTIIFGKAFQYEPSTGDLSTTEEFGSILIGQLDKYLSLSPIGTQSVFGRKSTRVAGGALFLLDQGPIAFCDCILQNQLVHLRGVNRY
jgi:hypothetical protein